MEEDEWLELYHLAKALNEAMMQEMERDDNVLYWRRRCQNGWRL